MHSFIKMLNIYTGSSLITIIITQFVEMISQVCISVSKNLQTCCRQTQTFAVPNLSVCTSDSTCFCLSFTSMSFSFLYFLHFRTVLCCSHFGISLSLCFSLWLCLQWRGSGWTGRPGLSAQFPVALALSRGSGVAACQFMVGQSARGRMRKLVSAPTHLVGVSVSLVGLQS